MLISVPLFFFTTSRDQNRSHVCFTSRRAFQDLRDLSNGALRYPLAALRKQHTPVYKFIRVILIILVKSITNIYCTHGNALSWLYYGDVCNLTKIARGIYSVIRRNIMRQWNKSAFSHRLRAQ